jgi:DNA-binding transcriptional regulator YdaS (Cro superfamily)
MTLNDLIGKLGGHAKVAGMCGVSHHAVAKWVQGRDPGIPMKHWPRLREATNGLLSLDDFERMNAAAVEAARARFAAKEAA